MGASLRFPLLGEPLSLDLVNTRVHDHGRVEDLMDDTRALAAWLAAESDRVPWTGSVSDADLRAVRELREAIAALLTACRTGARPDPAAVRKVNAALSTPAPAVRLAWTAGGPRASVRVIASRRDALLRALASDAVTILTGPHARLIRTCAHPDCVLQFIARDPRRRWCSPTVCGNRARVSRHHFRHRAES